jgi:hypothetical protein
LAEAVSLAADTWTVGHLSLDGEPTDALPASEKIASHLKEQLAAGSIEAAIMENTSTLPMTWRSLPEKEIRSMLEER